MPAAARKEALTDRSLKALKPSPAGRYTVWDAFMPGMAVRISAKGKRSFYAVKRRTGAPLPTWALLGVYPVMTLAEAREAARHVLGALIAGQDPKELDREKRRAAEVEAREAEANIFRAVAEGFERTYLPRMAPSSARMYRSYLARELVPVLGPKLVADIKRREIIMLIDGVADRSGASAAIATLSVLRKCLNWAMARDLIEANPASGVKVDDVIGTPKARDRLLSDAELAAIWRAIDTVGAPFSTIYRLLMLTGLRLNEIAAARWEHLDVATLTVPTENSKTGEAMLVPLPPLAVELFAAVPRFSGPYIFGSATAGQRPPQAFSAAKRRLDAALAEAGIPPFVVHDFRRAVRSGLGRLGVPAVVAELCLGHKQPGIVGVYDRHSYFTEKHDALLRWERHLLGVVSGEPDNNVVTMPARGRA
jgi:integrase